MPTSRESASATRFDAWAASGRGLRMAHGHAPLVTAVLDRWTLGPDSAVLDVGCGVGEALVEAGRRGAGFLAGIDVSAGMIAAARERLPDAELICGAAPRLPWDDDTFTHALSIESLYYHDDPSASLRAIRRVLRPGGAFASAVEFYVENTGSHAWMAAMGMDLHLWSTHRWTEAFEAAGFSDVEAFRVRRDAEVPEDFTPSATFPDAASYRAYLEAGALVVLGRA